jgi:hypothetical protein
VTILAVETQHALCVCVCVCVRVLFELHLTVSYIKIASLVQQRYYGVGYNKTYVRFQVQCPMVHYKVQKFSKVQKISIVHAFCYYRSGLKNFEYDLAHSISFSTIHVLRFWVACLCNKKLKELHYIGAVA